MNRIQKFYTIFPLLELIFGSKFSRKMIFAYFHQILAFNKLDYVQFDPPMHVRPLFSLNLYPCDNLILKTMLVY